MLLLPGRNMVKKRTTKGYFSVQQKIAMADSFTKTQEEYICYFSN